LSGKERKKDLKSSSSLSLLSHVAPPLPRHASLPVDLKAQHLVPASTPSTSIKIEGQFKYKYDSSGRLVSRQRVTSVDSEMTPSPVARRPRVPSASASNFKPFAGTGNSLKPTPQPLRENNSTPQQP